MAQKPRFGLIPIPIAEQADAVNGEVLVDRNTGHFYVKNANKVYSKTVENEDRLNEMVKRYPYQNPQLIFGNSNWSKYLAPRNGVTYAWHIATNTAGVKIDFATGSGNSSNYLAFLDYWLARSTYTKYFISATVTCLKGPGTVQLAGDVYTSLVDGTSGEPGRGSSGTHPITYHSWDFKLNETKQISGIFGEHSEITTDGTLTNSTPGGMFRPGFLFGATGEAAKGATYFITDLQIWQLPNYFFDYRSPYRGSDEIHPIHSNMFGTLLPDTSTVYGQAIVVPSSAKGNIGFAYTREMKFGVYSLGVRLKLNNNTLTTKCIKIQVHRLKKKPNYVSNSPTFNAADYDVIGEVAYAPNDFSEKDIYKMVYMAFEYTGAASVDNRLRVVVSYDNGPAGTITTSMDYMTIAPVGVGVYNRRK